MLIKKVHAKLLAATLVVAAFSWEAANVK